MFEQLGEKHKTIDLKTFEPTHIDKNLAQLNETQLNKKSIKQTALQNLNLSEYKEIAHRLYKNATVNFATDRALQVWYNETLSTPTTEGTIGLLLNYQVCEILNDYGAVTLSTYLSKTLYGNFLNDILAKDVVNFNDDDAVNQYILQVNNTYERALDEYEAIANDIYDYIQNIDILLNVVKITINVEVTSLIITRGILGKLN